MMAAQSLQPGLRAGPSTHSSCVHSPNPQKPPSQVPEQHWPGLLHADPSGEQGGAQTPAALQLPEQQSKSKSQPLPLGMQAPPQTPRSQMPVQQSSGEAQRDPF
jgi:hypothetical protein